jgi:xyloglucan-specific exo-beta-1,4-glucanase
VGFGKAASGKSFPSLFLAGQIAGVQALFRSDDAGVSWKRINDDGNQFAAVSRVTGDPRIHGRVYIATGGRGILYGDPAATDPGL